MISKSFKRIVQTPRGRLLWANIIKFGLWNGRIESENLLSLLEKFYKSVRYVSDKAYDLITNPTVFLPTQYFSTKLPSWITKLEIAEITKMIGKEPMAILGEVVANRGVIYLLEYMDKFLIFKLNEYFVYSINKLSTSGDMSKPQFRAKKLYFK